MKTFKDYLTEAAAQPSSHATSIPGLQVQIKSDGGWSTCSVKQITPDNQADKSYLEISQNGKVTGKIPSNQVHGLGANEERVLTIDGKEFWFGGKAAGGPNKATE